MARALGAVTALPDPVLEPVHTPACDASIAWTTINASEALPGIVTPLTWWLYRDPVERAMRGGFHEIGVLSRTETTMPSQVEARVWTAFYGRPAANLNFFRSVADRMPGTDGDSIESQIFGQVRPGVQNHPSYRRWPVAAAKMPLAVVQLPRRIRALRAQTDEWWRTTLAQPLSEATTAREQFRDATARFERNMRAHLLHSVISQAFYEQVTALAAAAGEPGLERALVTGYGSLDETAFLAELWEVSRGRRSLEQFITDHGYHGNGVGELANPSWRERPDAVEGLLDRYRSLDEASSPAEVERRQAATRRNAEARLRAGVPRSKRLAVAPVLKLAASYLPFRGTGKTATAQCLDVARRAARFLGEHGVVERADDVWFLRGDEILAPPVDTADRVAVRRARHEEFGSVEFAELWQGVPAIEPIELDGPITGNGVSQGVAQGTARVILHPEDGDKLNPGEIIVCVSTDPSWASLFLLAGGIVIDIGGPLSHGAIVARELGIPCVIGTRSGTRRITDGTQLRVDGSTGEVTLTEK